MKYTILEIMNAFSTFSLTSEVEITTLFKNINLLKNEEKYSSLLSEINFDEKGISSELISEIATSIINDDIIISKNKYLFFKMKNELRQKICQNIDNKSLCINFMNDFRNLTVQKEQIKQYNIKK